LLYNLRTAKVVFLIGYGGISTELIDAFQLWLKLFNLEGR
jgi:hypothetical protein